MRGPVSPCYQNYFLLSNVTHPNKKERINKFSSVTNSTETSDLNDSFYRSSNLGFVGGSEQKDESHFDTSK